MKPGKLELEWHDVVQTPMFGNTVAAKLGPPTVVVVEVVDVVLLVDVVVLDELVVVVGVVVVVVVVGIDVVVVVPTLVVVDVGLVDVVLVDPTVLVVEDDELVVDDDPTVVVDDEPTVVVLDVGLVVDDEVDDAMEVDGGMVVVSDGPSGGLRSHATSATTSTAGAVRFTRRRSAVNRCIAKGLGPGVAA